MPTKELWNMPDMVPAITYSDLPRAIEWFDRVFGFRERGEARLTWPGGGMTWIEAGTGLFNIMTPDETKFDQRVPRVDGAHAIHVERVAVEIRHQRTDGERPNAIVVLLHGAGCAAALRSEIAHQSHRTGFGRKIRNITR
jgi:hypothetical protein